MFYNCKKLENLNVLNFDIKENCNIENMINNIANDYNIKANSKTFKKIFN